MSKATESSVLLDGWCFQCAAITILQEEPAKEAFDYKIFAGGGIIKPYDRTTTTAMIPEAINWSNFLSAILIWDKLALYSPNNIRILNSLINVADIKAKKSLQTIKREIIDDKQKDNRIPDGLAHSLKTNAPSIDTGYNDDDEETILQRRTNEYIQVGDALEIPLFSHPNRDRYINNSNSTLRDEYLRKMDEEFEKAEYVKMLQGYKLPVLYSYIQNGLSGDAKFAEELSVAIELRNTRFMKHFRAMICEVEQNINNGVRGLEKTLFDKELPQAVASVVNDLNKHFNIHPVSNEPEAIVCRTIEGGIKGASPYFGIKHEESEVTVRKTTGIPKGKRFKIQRKFVREMAKTFMTK